MLSLPSSLKPIFMSLSVAFTEPTFRHVVVLMVGGILACGRHTVTAALRAVPTWDLRARVNGSKPRCCEPPLASWACSR